MKHKVLIMLVLVTICVAVLVTGVVFAQGGTNVYTKVTSPFGVGNNYSYASSTIPNNSTIYHGENGVTEFYGSDNTLLLSTKDSEASQITTPEGMMPATRIIEVPSRAFVDHQGNVTKIYSDTDKKNCILTIIDEANSSNTQSLMQSSNAQLTLPSIVGWVEDANTWSNPFSSLNTFNAY